MAQMHLPWAIMVFLPVSYGFTVPVMTQQGPTLVGNPPAPSGDPSCLALIYHNLKSCEIYVIPGGDDTPPPVNGECCNNLRALTTNNPQCVCALVKPASYNFPIDWIDAKALVVQCQVSLPPLSNCPDLPPVGQPSPS